MLVREAIPCMINGRPPTRVFPGTTSIGTDAPPYIFPPVENQPYHIVYNGSLLQDMMDDLKVYLARSPGGNIDSPLELIVYLNKLNAKNDFSSLDRQLSTEESTKEYWVEIFTIIKDCVAAVERPANLPCTLPPTMIYGQTSDGILAPYLGGKPTVHIEHKSWVAFERISSEILGLAKANGESGTKLAMSPGSEQGSRSIIFKIGVSMITNDIPYAILFGGDKFMISSLFTSPANGGRARRGLFFSDIITVDSTTRPLIPYTMKIPVCDDNPILEHYKPRRSRTLARRIEKLNCDIANLTISFHYSGPVEDTRVFTLNRQFSGNIATSSDATASSNTVGPIPPPHVLKPLPKTKDNNLLRLKLWEEVGYGITGHTFFASTLDSEEEYIIKLASSPGGRWMLRQEAEIYDTLKSLQGNILPQVYGFFTSEWSFALLMEDMGDVVENMENLSLSQRAGLQKDLELIHEQGVIHGDLRVTNLMIKDGRPHIIDFSHASQHHCPGRQRCDELLTSLDFFRLGGNNIAIG